MIQPWKVIESALAGNFSVFRIHRHRKVNPRNQHPHDFFVCDSPPWVNVVAITPDQQLVAIEQFRHGTNSLELEIPGGVIDPQDASPLAAGIRELREETGYAGAPARLLGDVFPNPAIMSNTCYTVLVENCTRSHEVQFDSGEDLTTRLIPLAEIPNLVAEGKIRHSLVVVALYYFELYQRGLKQAV